MEELQPLCQCGSIVPPDEIIKINCLQMAVDHQSIDPLAFAKEMYNWVKDGKEKINHDEFEQFIDSRIRLLTNDLGKKAE
jgi:hypothetical protein